MPSDVQTWNAEQLANARVIVSVGQQMGLSSRDIQIGLMTAMQESGLRNLNYGDRDSLGLFQQRPSQGWGSRAQVTNPEYAARKFFTALKDVKGRDSLSLSAAAQAVQRSAYPDAYAKHELKAAGLLSSLGLSASTGQASTADVRNAQGTAQKAPTAAQAPIQLLPDDPELSAAQDGTQGAGGPSADPAKQGLTFNGLQAADKPLAPVSEDDYLKTVGAAGAPIVSMQKGTSAKATGLVNYAESLVGTPYAWGGTQPGGFDCSGFVQYVYKKMGVNLPRISYQQAQAGTRIDTGQLKAGDLVAWDNSSRNNGADHIAIYMGNGQIIEAPRPGLGVRVRKLGSDEGAWGVQMNLGG